MRERLARLILQYFQPPSRRCYVIDARMENVSKFSRFAKYAWFVLAWNIVVILWGVFLRASKSGDGCGRHWLTCHGEVIPSAPELKTVIEFTHRISSVVDGLFVIAMVVWAGAIWYSSRTPVAKRVLCMAAGSLIFVLIEGLIGRGLVLTGNTAETLTPERPLWMSAHLINTLILLAFLTLTAWYASARRQLAFTFKASHAGVIILGALLIFLVGISGSIAALSSMIFPSGTLADELAKDFSTTSHVLVRLRLVHPILAIFSGVYLVFAVGWLKSQVTDKPGVKRWSNIISVLVVAQLAFGAATLVTFAPIVMQLGHLLLADAVWIAFVLMTANFLATENPASEAGLE